MTFLLLKNLLKYNDIKISAILLNDGRLADELKTLGIDVSIIDEGRNNILQIYWKIKKIVDRDHPDVIHSHRYKENLLASVVSSRGKKINIMATIHGMPEGFSRSAYNNIVSKLNFHILSRDFRRVVAVSDDMRKSLIDLHGFPKDKIFVIRNGVEIPAYVPINKENNSVIIGSAGRLFPVKDYLLMVEVAMEINRKYKNVRFELAGEGPEMENIQALIKKYDLEKVFILRGFMNNIASFYQGLDLYINTSLHEGIPISILEAMAYSLPIVAINVGGNKEILEDGVQGYLISSRDPVDIAEKCVRILENPSLKQKMGSAAREKLEREFSVARMADKYNELYLSIATRR